MNRKAVHSLIIFLFIAFTRVAAVKASDDVIERQKEHRNDTYSWFSQVYGNPAMQWNRYQYSLNRLAVTYTNSCSTLPKRLEDGDNMTVAGGYADAFLRKKKTSLWGTAYYTKGKYYHIRYNETTDFDVLYPYVMADTVGGGVSHREAYNFKGGFAHRKDKWNLGVEGCYTARLEYRTVDPRPKNLTSCLQLKAGTSWSGLFNETYEGGLSAGVKRYKQTNMLEFYNETSQPTVWHLTGLGMDYYRFRGAYASTYYKGLGWDASIELRPVALRNGIYSSLNYSSMFIEKIISDLNELPLTKLKLYHLGFESGYLHKAPINTWAIKLTGEYNIRQGIENIFGSAQDNVFPQIASGQQYSDRQWHLWGTLLWQYHPSNIALYNLSISQHYQHQRETYFKPIREISSMAHISAISLKGMWQLKRLLLQTSALFDYAWDSRCSMMLEGSVHESMMIPVYHRCAFNGNKRYNASLQAEADYAMNRHYSLFIAAKWDYAHYMKTEHSHLFSVSLGIEF